LKLLIGLLVAVGLIVGQNARVFDVSVEDATELAIKWKAYTDAETSFHEAQTRIAKKVDPTNKCVEFTLDFKHAVPNRICPGNTWGYEPGSGIQLYDHQDDSKWLDDLLKKWEEELANPQSTNPVNRREFI
jgi:hypothetical protein